MPKQLDVKAEKIIGENHFYIRAYPAMKAVNMSGDLFSIVLPIFGSLASLVGIKPEEAASGLMDVDTGEAAAALAKGLSSLSGDKLESLMNKLLIKYRTVSVQLENESEAQILTEDLANEIFCGEAQGLYILAYEVIRVNFQSFFSSAKDLFGGRLDDLLTKLGT